MSAVSLSNKQPGSPSSQVAGLLSAMADSEETPNATVYVRRLDERIKIPTLIESLREIFAEFGNIIDIVAKKNLRAKGQAFVVYDSVESAQDAIDSLQGFELFDQPMELAFAKSRSDATVKKEDGDEALEAHKKRRLAEKERRQAQEAMANPAKRSAQESTSAPLAERPAKVAKPGATGPAGTVPDEYLPPNKILILRELPEEYGKDELTAVFNRFPGFKEVRLVPGRKGIAFAEYEDENGAITAKEAMNAVQLVDKVIRVTFQRT